VWSLVIIMVLLAASIAVNVITIRQNLVLMDQRERLVDTIESSLDVLDGCFQDLSRLASTPVMSDEPVVRETVNAMARARNAVLAIAADVVVYGRDDADDEDER